MSEEQTDSSGKQANAKDNISLCRRSYLKATAGGAALIATGSMVSAETQYDIINVSSGETYRKHLGDEESLENVLIDISAQGAEYDISASGNDWSIRNVGIRGHWDRTTNTDPFRLRVPDDDKTGVVENVHLGITTESDRSYGGGPSGMFVWRDHAGHIDIRGCYLNDYQDNGIYASAPGNPNSHPFPGSGGTVRIEDCYAHECGTSNFRLGTDGSSIHNSVSVGGWRGIWAFIEETDIYDSDILNSESGDIALGDGNYVESDTAEVALNNSRWGTEVAHGGATTDNIHATSVDTPQDRLPENCPGSPEEAASGESITESDSYLPEGDFEVEITTNSSLAEYLIEVDADEVIPGSDTNKDEDEYQDRAFERNGRWYIHGYTAGGVESYQIKDGQILRIGDFEESSIVTVAGQRLDLDTFDSITEVPNKETEDRDGDDILAKKIVVDGSNNDDVSNYTFKVTGEVEKNDTLTQVENSTAWDELPSDISDQRVIGIVGNGKNMYRYSGNVTVLRISGNATVRLGE